MGKTSGTDVRSSCETFETIQVDVYWGVLATMNYFCDLNRFQAPYSLSLHWYNDLFGGSSYSKVTRMKIPKFVYNEHEAAVVSVWIKHLEIIFNYNGTFDRCKKTHSQKEKAICTQY